MFKRIEKEDSEPEFATSFNVECLCRTPKPLKDAVNFKDDLNSLFRQGLEGKLEHKFYLSSLDPGLGKTESYLSFLRWWKASDFEPEGSVLICLSTIREIEEVIPRSGLGKADYAVLVTASNPLNQLGRGASERDKARVLFTTHSMMEKRLRGKLLAFNESLHFEGKARTLRIWDESLLPRTPVSIRVDDMAGLASPLRGNFPGFVAAVEAFVLSVRTMGAGGSVMVPAFTSDISSALPSKRLDPDEEKTVDALLRMQGCRMQVVHDRYHGLALVGATQALPDDIKPLIILDASGRVSSTYDLWETHGTNLVRLPSVAADYANLSVHVWQNPAGKKYLGNGANRRRIVEELVRIINANPSEPWLVIGKKDSLVEIQKEVDDAKPRSARVEYLNWGAHFGVNDYREFKNIIVIGAWPHTSAAYQARYIAATGACPSTLSGKEWTKIKSGELKGNLLQAICRGNVRNHTGGRCGDSTVYLIVDKGCRPLRLVRETFPGCKVLDWTPIMATPSKHAAAVIEVIKKAFEEPSLARLRKAVVLTRAGISAKVASGVYRHRAVAEYLTSAGLAMDARWFKRQVP